MTYKTLIFGTDDLYPSLKPFYDAEVKRGNLEITAHAELANDTVNLVYTDGKRGGAYDFNDFELAIISSSNDFYNRMKLLEAQGISRDKIIDGRVFAIPNFDFPRLLEEGIAYGAFNKDSFPDEKISRFCIYPRIFMTANKISSIKLGIKSTINGAHFSGDHANGTVAVGNYSQISWGEFFEFQDGGHNPARGHHYKYLSSFAFNSFDWKIPSDIFPNISQKQLQILIGSDVWIGMGCKIKSTNPNKPLVIGDGAVVASNSVVVKDVPPYAIVGGNPAKIIKYRFPPQVIAALLRIKWWDWNLDKIYDNFKYFNDVEKFVSMHDEQFNLEKADDDFDYLNDAESFISLNYSNDEFKTNDVKKCISMHDK